MQRLPGDRLKRWQGKAVHRGKSCVTAGRGGWRRFNEGSRLYRASVTIQFFFSLSFHVLCNAPLPPLLATMIPSTTEAITYAKRRERGRSNEPSTIGTRLGPGRTISALFRPRFQLSWKKGGVYGARSVDKLSR